MTAYSVGVVTYNRPAFFERLLEGLHDQTVHPSEFVVVDGGREQPVDGLLDEHRAQFVEDGVSVTYAREDSSTAQPGARNRVLELTTGDVICYVDDDEVPEPMWLEKLVEGYREFPEAVGVGGPMLPTDEELEPVDDGWYSVQGNLNDMNEYGEFCFASEEWIPPEPVETRTLPGGNMSFKTAALERVGGFDEDLRGGPAYHEEIQPMAAFWKEGVPLVYHPDAAVNHLEAATGGSRVGDAVTDKYWLGVNTVIFMKKNFPENYRQSMTRLVFGVGERYSPVSLAFSLRLFVRQRDVRWLGLVCGYLYGIVRFTGRDITEPNSIEKL